MSELARRREPLEEHIDKFHEQFRTKRVAEDVLACIEEEHLGLLRPVPP